ncbi:MAG: 4'-phosphopantetheinyl transferase family protein [Planctomycetota bacterium]|jgi:4'-phosphopantetheinyl transferase
MAGSISIDLWTWPLDVDAAERERLARFLSDDELARAQRFHFARDSERHIIARGRLREILAARVSSSPGNLQFAYSEYGKPTLVASDPPPPHFNLSHSHGLAALAISDGAELGLDIEAIRPLKEDIAGRFFSSREVAGLRALDEADQLPGFYRCWTRKEAVLKALGDGLRRPLDSFDVSLADDAPARIERMEGEANAPREWELVHFIPATGFVGAIALRSHGARVTLARRSS